METKESYVAEIQTIMSDASISVELRDIAKKVFDGKRLTPEEGLYLYENAELGYLGILANFVREKLHGDKTYFNRNFHIEPTNVCVYNCKFCSYSRKFNHPEAWEYDIEDIVKMTEQYKGTKVTEVHIVGGVHPHHDLHYYGKMIKRIKSILPEIHVKAFTAVEIEFMSKKAKMTIEEGLRKLKEYGLDSIPGGGAEIFDEQIRAKICPDKTKSVKWLKIHETAHKLGIKSNATILYGHIENYSHRIDHLTRLRDLQDKTHGFQTFIPLKYRQENNKMSEVGEVSTIEDLRNYAVSRIYLDNFPHLKAYWVMIGRDTAKLSLSFGVDDLDGTIDDSTKIYTMAGVEEQSPNMTTDEIVELIKSAGRKPIERDTLYNVIQEF